MYNTNSYDHSFCIGNFATSAIGLHSLFYCNYGNYRFIFKYLRNSADLCLVIYFYLCVFFRFWRLKRFIYSLPLIFLTLTMGIPLVLIMRVQSSESIHTNGMHSQTHTNLKRSDTAISKMSLTHVVLRNAFSYSCRLGVIGII